MDLRKSWWLWSLSIFILIILVQIAIKAGNLNYCLQQTPYSYEYNDEEQGTILGCPPRCYVGSCFGIKTACCPRGIEMLFD